MFADGFERECLEDIAADMRPKLLSFSPRVSEPSYVNTIFLIADVKRGLFCTGTGKLVGITPFDVYRVFIFGIIPAPDEALFAVFIFWYSQ